MLPDWAAGGVDAAQGSTHLHNGQSLVHTNKLCAPHRHHFSATCHCPQEE